MSTRQKSFFDQNQEPKHPRGQWNHPRNPSFPRHREQDAPPPRRVVTGPPIMPSTQTRTKLNAFQFIQGAPAAEPSNVLREDKENIFRQQKTKETPRGSKVADNIHDASSKTPRLEQSETCPPPSTPATRPPLADLVGNADEVSRNASKPFVSPEEQLLWRGSQPVNTPLPRKGKKRARSSSPIAASQEELNLDSAKKELNTPLADPALELWTRYTSKKGTPTASKGVTFAHLINESSPRSSATAGSVSGLRRWASCGVEFPASNTKRRRTHGVFRADREHEAPVGDVFGAPCSDCLAHGQPEKSKLAGMLERMRESIAKPQTKLCSSELPSSSSPLPGVGDRLGCSTESPLQRHARAQEEEDGTGKDAEARRSSGSSDEFGDEEFDTEMVEALEISQQEKDDSLEGIPASDGPADVLPALPVQSNHHATVAAPDDGSDDEFGLDEDVFAADLEQVASLYDTRLDVSPANENMPVMEANDESLNNAAPAIIDLVDDDSDDFGGEDINADEFAAAEVAATQGYASTSQQDARAIQRYLIKQVDEYAYIDERGHEFPEKVLRVEEESTKIFRQIILRQAWYDTPCTPESYVHVIGEFSSGRCLIDDSQNMLILHPDHLISATVVADSFGCRRRAVLQDRIKATSRANPPMLYGTLLHELFQEAMKVNRWDSEFLLGTVDRLLPAKFDTILEINSTCEQVKAHLSSKLLELQSWAEMFVRAKPRDDAVVRERNGRQALMSINKLLDIEEHVWSPMYGLKGNIDATVQVTMQDDQGERVLTVPFEVKTGKNSTSTAHVAQIALYNLLLSNRYDVDVAYGILYYLEASDISRIPAIRNDIIHMIIQRNELACYVRDRLDLPPMLKEDFKCQKCYAQEPCFLYEKLVEDGNGELLNKKAKERYDELVVSLTPADQNFMKKWDALLTKEESDMMKFRRELWTMLSTEREKLGRCFSNVILEPGSGREEKNNQKINRYSYTFIKQKPKPGFSFTESQLVIGEPVVVSDERGHFALANGYVTNVRKRRITVAVDRRLHNARTKLPDFSSQRNQNFTGIMEVGKEAGLLQVSQEDDELILYRLDKDEFSNGMAAARNNLIRIMDDSVYKARDLRSLIIGNRAPVFKPISETLIASMQKGQMSMNRDQKAAIAKVMSAKDYALVLGMPGTGKTTTIAYIIRALIAQGKSILLTSYTHTAVDNILLKIRHDDIGILRLGAAAKVHPEVREFATLAAEPRESLEELEKSWMDPLVVATTCLTINHPLFSRRIFDYCIVDEASQITLPVCLGPIRMSQKFILVGDHHQLPPLVQNKEALEGGLDVSLFKLLCEAHPQAVVSLEHQYRMCAEIMLLSNTFIYSGRLKCGTPSVASRQLHLPNPSGLFMHHGKPTPDYAPTDPICPGPESPGCWLKHVLNPSSPVIFINTDAISQKLELQAGLRITNAFEARLITHLTISLLSLGVPANEIGVIAFYRSQLALLRQYLGNVHTQTQSSELAAPAIGQAETVAAVELHTADKFQGRDKEVVIVSCVRSNEAQVVGDLLRDKRRINVALTRARSKLVIVGSERTLEANELLGDLIKFCREKGWVMDVRLEQVEGHVFKEAVGSLTGRLTDNEVMGRSQSGTRTTSRTPSKKASPRKKQERKPLGDVTTSGTVNRFGPPSTTANLNQENSREKWKNKTGEKMKTPGKVFIGVKKGMLDARPVLRDVYHGAL